MSNSILATYTKLSKCCTKPRKSKIDTITIHCIVGQWTAKFAADYFAKANSQEAPNYVVGYDGSIALCVEEKDRAWTTGGTDLRGNVIRCNGISGADNDHRAITIEVASDTKRPYAVTDAAMEALIRLLADICRRNPGIGELKWAGDKKYSGDVTKQNMTMHRWYSLKECPGDYLADRYGYIAEEVNKLIKSGKVEGVVEIRPYQVRVSVSDLRIRSKPGTNYKAVGIVKPGIYTIIEESDGRGAIKWGKLKSGAGWIALDYTKRL